MKNLTRRRFLTQTGIAGAGVVAACTVHEPPAPAGKPSEPLFRISLAQWSFHRTLFGGDPGETIGWENFAQTLRNDYSRVLAGTMDPLDFPVIARRDFGIEAVEYVNTFYFNRAEDQAYLAELKRRADGEGVRSVLIMCDAEGDLGAPKEGERIATVERHYKWVEAARFLGCHSIRVNAASDPALPPDEQQKLAADGLHRLCEFADGRDINILVENHGGWSSHGGWLAELIRMVDHPRAGTLPDFANFTIGPGQEYDRYQGVTELLPYAKAVSAKSHDFDEHGNETSTDFRRMMKIVLDAGYHGYVGIEYEGSRLSEPEGIRATKALLERVREELSA